MMMMNRVDDEEVRRILMSSIDLLRLLYFPIQSSSSTQICLLLSSEKQ